MEPSDRRPLGTSSVTVTRLGLGTAPIGGLYQSVPEAEALDVVRRSYELGVRFIDTAPQYGHGLAESRLGLVLPTLPRDEIIVGTKVGRLIRHASLAMKARTVLREAIQNRDIGRLRLGATRFANRLRSRRRRAAGGAGTSSREATAHMDAVFDFSYDGVMTSIDESLQRLQLSRIDVLYIHDPDFYHKQALDGAYRALDRLRADGTVGAIGVGMNSSVPLARFAREAPFDCFLVAGRYTLLDQAALTDLLPECEKRGMSVVVGGIYNSGILADPRPGTHFDYHTAPPELVERAQRMQAVCARHDVPLMAAAIQFPFGHPAVASVLTGSRSLAEIEQNVAMFQTPIPDALWGDLKAEGLLPGSVPVPAADRSDVPSGRVTKPS